MGSGSISKRKKKRSQSQKHSKKKSRRNKDKRKKLKRRHDSVSCSEDDSKLNSLLSDSSSEEVYRGRKRSRSRDRKDRKDRKKRVKRGNSVSESSGDDSPVVKKRKKSKTSKGSESRKKRHGKKRKRSPSVSSASGRSMSHSSCDRSGGSESEEVKERKGREKGNEKRLSKKREKSKERSSSKRKCRSRSRSPCSLRSQSNSYASQDRMVNENNTKTGVNKSKHRSESRSPCTLHSESHSYDSEDRMVEENNTKRLKSIIVVVHEKDEPEIRDSNWDGNKAEIVFEHDEYPSRSNDSNDGVIRRETSSFSHDVSSGKLKSFDDTNREIVPCDVQTSEIPERQSVVTEKTGGINLTTSGSGGNSQLKGNGISVSAVTASSNGDDLAAALRQKALENFLKRQVKSSAKNAGDKKGGLVSEPNSSSPLKTNQAPHTSAEHLGLRSVQKLGKADEGVNIADFPSSLKADNNATLPRRASAISRLTENKYTAPSGFADSRTKVGLSSPRKEFTGARNTWRRQLVSHASSLPNPEQNIGKDAKQKLDSAESSQQKLSTLNKTVIKDFRQQYTSQEVSQPSPLTLKTPVDKDSKKQLTSQEVSQPTVSAPKVIDLRPIKGSGSSRIDSSVSASQASDIVEHDSNENTNEADGDSQFQQKTMSVMRGGEMVQVSYKVYIPNKAPALARRQLKR